MSEVVEEVTAFLEESWDPDLTVAEWWDRLGSAGWSAPTWPTESYGRGLTRSESVEVQRTIKDFGALGAPGGLGLMLAGPTIVDHGTDDQKERYLRDIVTGQIAWCQLFSEPGAGSDLAGLQARAEQDGDVWVVNGQKVWTSNGHHADLGMLIARTNVDVPKHQGITYFAINMHQPGMDVRPLKEMTGRALFNEVFMSDVQVGNDAVIGGLGNGWAVANTTLKHERSSLGAGGGSAGASAAVPGTVAGDLDKRVGDFVKPPSKKKRGGDIGSRLFGIAAEKGKLTDPIIRQRLMKMYTAGQIATYNGLRQKAASKAGNSIPGLPNISKLGMSEIVATLRDLGLDILGPDGMLHTYPSQGPEDEVKELSPSSMGLKEMALFSPAPSIYGGTDQIQRNILGERVLGLPKEPNQDKVLPFKDLPKNT